MNESAPRELLGALRAAHLEVLDDDGTRAMYASDASLYRVPPLAVVRPRDAAEVATALDLTAAASIPFTSRGGGTSIAGNAVGRGVVLDFSRHMDRVLGIDPESATAVVEPGANPDVLQTLAAAHGLRFGPDPSSHSRCTIGGMIGNNACGSRALGYGRTSDNVAELKALLASGERLVTGYASEGSPTVDGPQRLIDELHAAMRPHLATARQEFDRFGRQMSGYPVHHLLPERFDLTKALIGSEGTLAVVTEATVRLVRDPTERVLVVLGFRDLVEAAAVTPDILAFAPIACEGMDVRLLDALRAHRGPSHVPEMPAGDAWLLVELAGEERDEVLESARRLMRNMPALESAVIEDAHAAARLWRIRENGAGLAGRAPSGLPAWPGWEDAAVPPDRLGAYLARFEALLVGYGMTAAPYGHFGDGCVHVRLDLPLDRPDGLHVVRRFLEAAADLVAEFGGSLSGEHGDGRARSDLLPRMYSTDAMALFRRIKHVFDPGNVLNPGVIVEPEPLDAAVRPVGVPRMRAGLAFAYEADAGDFAQAVHRCTGAGKCRADNGGAGGVMCPSYLATKEEKDSTRGRARVLQEVVRGALNWDSPAVTDALDLCLSCKACASDCPTGIDMATYKSEVLYQRYRRRPRPRTHYSLGWLPTWTRLAGRLPTVANSFLRTPLLGQLAVRAAGVDARRSLPMLAENPFHRWWRRRQSVMTPEGAWPVTVFLDCFTNYYRPEPAQAAINVLRKAGYDPTPTHHRLCCGLTWISTGQLDKARRTLARTVRTLAPQARAHGVIVGLEPSCAAALRHDAVELLANTDAADAARTVAAAVTTLGGLLRCDGWTPPSLVGTTVVAMPHCHHHAVLDWNADHSLLEGTGADVSVVAGCCGLAGNFGVERGHYDLSVKIAEHGLLPALRAAPDAVVLADGFSCRTQIDDLSGRPSLHLAEFLDR